MVDYVLEVDIAFAAFVFGNAEGCWGVGVVDGVDCMLPAIS